MAKIPEQLDVHVHVHVHFNEETIERLTSERDALQAEVDAGKTALDTFDPDPNHPTPTSTEGEP